MFLSVFFVLLQGCPDPTTAADLGNPGPGGGAPGPADGPGPGFAEGPPPAPDQFDVGDEGGVLIGGVLEYSGDKTGQVRLDFLRTEGDAPPQLLHVEKLDALGPFEMRVPANTGPVTIVAFVDIDDDGPNSTDPAGLVQLAIEEAAMSNVSIVLSDAPDLGALTPGSAPPSATDASGAAPEAPEIETPKAPPEEVDAAPSAAETKQDASETSPKEQAEPPSQMPEGTDSE